MTPKEHFQKYILKSPWGEAMDSDVGIGAANVTMALLTVMPGVGKRELHGARVALNILFDLHLPEKQQPVPAPKSPLRHDLESVGRKPASRTDQPKA